MADTSGQADIRGINIDKLVKGFADETLMMKKFVTNASTSAREVRWYQKTSGFLTGTTTTDLTGELIANTSDRSLPTVVEQSWTRNTSYVKKYFVESPLFSMEDLKDTDVDILATNVRDLVKAVSNQVDKEIYWTISDSTTHGTPASGSSVPSGAAVADGWDDAVTGDPIADIMAAKTSIRQNNYDPEGAIMLLNPIDHANLLNYLINVKGSSIPNFSSERVKDGVVMEVLGVKIVVSNQFDTDYATVFVPQRTATWKAFTGLTSAVMDDPGIGKKIRVWEEGVCLLTDPNAAYVITDIVV